VTPAAGAGDIAGAAAGGAMCSAGLTDAVPGEATACAADGTVGGSGGGGGGARIGAGAGVRAAPSETYAPGGRCGGLPRGCTCASVA